MKDFLKCYGSWSLIAGAAEGIGAAFAEALASKGMNIIMVDSNEQAMKELSERMIRNNRINVIAVLQDLSEKTAWQKCMDVIRDLDCRLLIYVPAYSKVQPFITNTPDDIDRYLDLNCRTPSKMVLEFAKRLKDKGHGGIILMSSLAGHIGTPYVAAYAATKAFNTILAESLSGEFSNSRIDITVCCAGPTRTPTYLANLRGAPTGGSTLMDPAIVANYALKNLGKKTVCIPGFRNRFYYFLLTRILPRRYSAAIIKWVMSEGQKKTSLD